MHSKLTFFYNKQHVLLIASLFLTSFGFAQQEETQLLIEQLVEQMADELGEDYDYEEISTRLLYYNQHRIDINKTKGNDLKELPFLSPIQIENLLLHREKSGLFQSLIELQAINGFDHLTVERLLHFVSLQSLKVFENFKGSHLKQGTHDLMLRYGKNLQQSEGYRRTEESGMSRYLGNPDRYLVRYRYQLPKKFQVALNMKKDAGEPFLSGAQKHGFDFHSASLHFFEIGKVKNLVIGDYSLQFGQGLSLWSGLSFGKGALLQNVARQGIGVRPYTSTNEVLFLRGLSGTIKLNNFEISPFMSYRKLDGTVDEGGETFSALGASGYHRTETENKNRKAIDQLLYGLNGQYELNRLKVGASIYRTEFNKILIPTPRIYNKFDFSGDKLTNSSVYYNYTFPGTYAFGELAYSSTGGFASIQGLISSLSNQLSLVLLHRYYQKNYFSLYNQAFSENSEAKNEKGFYSGLQWSPTRKLSMTFYADYFTFPWLKFRVDAPSKGYDIFSLFTYTHTKKTEANIRYRFRKKQENSAPSHPVSQLEDVLKHQVRMEAKYAWRGNISFRSRLELTRYLKDQDENETGWMVYQDFIYRPLSSIFSGNIRFAYFNTDGHDSRIYAFENDVLYGYSFPAYANQGIRYYGNLRYRVNRNMDLWFRYASFLFNEHGIGSGLDAIDSKVKSDIRVQLRVRI